MSGLLPDAFPTLGEWTTADAATSASHLVQIDAWRASWLRWMETAESLFHVSPELRAVLIELFGETPLVKTRSFPYRLRPFPTDPHATRLEEVMMWRAGIIDFLSDAWDTIGATFDIAECGRLSALLMPKGTGDETCSWCLALVPKDAQRTHFNNCSVQRRWRQTPA